LNGESANQYFLERFFVFLEGLWLEETLLFFTFVEFEPTHLLSVVVVRGPTPDQDRRNVLYGLLMAGGEVSEKILRRIVFLLLPKLVLRRHCIAKLACVFSRTMLMR
jgi:hypothetical protein